MTIVPDCSGAHSSARCTS